MIEGQNGLNWPRWTRLAGAVEQLGFPGLYRSDHFTNSSSPDMDSLELWVSLTWLATNTRRLTFGPLVTPLSFRHPVHTARMAMQVDELSGGRLTLGVGAGWQEREHDHFGFDLLGVPQRFARFEEGLEVITRLLRSEAPVDFEGRYFRLREAALLPRTPASSRPPILVGGRGKRRTLPLAARYAVEWNANFLRPEEFAELNSRLDRLLKERGRAPGEVKRSLMTGMYFGANETEVGRKLAARGRTADDLRGRGVVVGTPGEIIEQLGRLGEAGVQRVMLQWLDLDDLDGLEALARTVLPQLR